MNFVHRLLRPLVRSIFEEDYAELRHSHRIQVQGVERQLHKAEHRNQLDGNIIRDLTDRVYFLDTALQKSRELTTKFVTRMFLDPQTWPGDVPMARGITGPELLAFTDSLWND